MKGKRKSKKDEYEGGGGELQRIKMRITRKTGKFQWAIPGLRIKK